MGTQTQDTFQTGGRGAGPGIAAWNPSSGGDTWTVQQSGSNFSFTGSQGQTTGSTTANIVTLNGTASIVTNGATQSATKQWYDSVVSARFQKTNSNDSCGVVARLTNSNNLIHASVSGGQLTINKVVNGTGTQLASIAFADGGALFHIKLSVQGFGLNGAAQNIQAKAWLDSSSEPSSYMIGASDASVVGPGLVGVRLKGNATGNTQSVDSFLAIDPPQFTPAPAYNCYEDLPYGYTNYVVGNNPPIYAQQMLSDVAAWGNGSVVRHQLMEKAIEIAPNLYDWALLDDMVYRCNQAGVKVWLCLQGFASWRQTRDGYGSNATLNQALTAGQQVSTLKISALPAGAFIPDGATLTINYGGLDSGGGGAETVTISSSGKTYTQGAQSLSIVPFTPANNHVVGEPIFAADNGQTTNGPQLPNPSDFATYAGLVAARYNGQAGYGKIDYLQVFNEEMDTITRIGASQNASWDNGGGILGPIYVAAYNAIKAVYPGCVVVAGAVRKTPAMALAHITNWLNLFFAYVASVGGSVDETDGHYYRDSVTDWDGTPVPDPTKNTYTDGTKTVVNCPSIGLELWTLKQCAIQNGFPNCPPNIGEFGWSLYDDGGGVAATTNATYTSGAGPYTSLSLSANLSKTIGNATPIFVDYQNTGKTELVYAYGQTNSGHNSIQITTDPRGNTNGIAQVGWVPAFSHASVTIYCATTTNVTSPTADYQYTKSMYDACQAAGASHCLRYDLNSLGVVTEAQNPEVSNWPKSWTQTQDGQYRYAPGYYLTMLYAQDPRTKYWKQPDYRSLPLTADAGSLPLTANANSLPLSATVP